MEIARLPGSTCACLLLLLMIAGCGRLHHIPWSSSPNERPATTRAEVDERIRALVNLEGEYLFGDAVYSLGDNEDRVNAIAAADTLAIRSLVACFSDGRRTHVTLHGQRVTVGRLCAEALIRTDYVRTGMQRRAFPEGWRGFPSPSLDSLDLGPVQVAWFQWMHDHHLAWPPPPLTSLPCPSGESIRAERFRDSLGTDGARRTQLRIRKTLTAFRYVTYVIDSEFVLLADTQPRTASDSLRADVLHGLSDDDVESVSVRKSQGEAWKWRACEGVPIVLLTTKSKRWRPRTSR